MKLDAKHSGIVSLVLTIIAYMIELITKYISLPFPENVISFITICAFISFIAACSLWIYTVLKLPDSSLQLLKLIKDSDKETQKYWLITYKENDYIACSILEIRDNCESRTRSTLQDYNNDLSVKNTFGVQGKFIDGYERLSRIYATGSNHHIFIRLVFVKQDEFNIFRIDDNDSDTATKVTGDCRAITPKMLIDASICNNDKMAKKMLSSFSLDAGSKAILLKYVHQKMNTSYAMKILNSCSKREKSEEKMHQQLDSISNEPAKKKVHVSKAKMGKV